jgi:hypothetical protein
MSFLGDSCVFRIAGSRHLAPLTDPVVGSAALRATMRHFIDTWEMKALEIVDIHVEGDVALVHRSGQMCHGTTDFDTEVMDKMTFDNGKVIECVGVHRHASSRIIIKHRDDLGGSEIAADYPIKRRACGQTAGRTLCAWVSSATLWM